MYSKSMNKAQAIVERLGQWEKNALRNADTTSHHEYFVGMANGYREAIDLIMENLK